MRPSVATARLWSKFAATEGQYNGVAMRAVITSLAVMYVYFGLLSAAGVEPDTDLPDGVFDNAGPFLVLFFISVFVAPPVEEIFFRGFIFGGLRGRWGPLLAAVASGALFGLAHVGNPGTLYLLPPIGAAWAYATDL